MQGYGVKFLGEGNPMRGQNERAVAAVYQVVEGQFRHVWPKIIATAEPARPAARLVALGGPLSLTSTRGGGRSPPPRQSPLVLTVSRLTKQFGGFTALNAVSFEVKQGEILGPHRAQRLRQDHLLQLHLRRAHADGGLDPLQGSTTSPGLTPDAVCHRGLARTFQIPRPFRKLVHPRERGGGRALRRGHSATRKPRRAAAPRRS